MNGARRLVGLILVGLAAPFLPASGALAAGPVDPQPQIVNGLATSDWPDVAYLATGIGFCSATFIGCRTVLTAAHCVCDSGGTGPACPDGTSLLDPLPMFVFLQHAGFAYLVTDVRVEPNYSFAFAGDAAVLEVLYPVRGIRPSPINTLDDPSLGTAGTVVGFGRTSDSASDAGVKRWGSVITSSCSGAGVPNSTHACWSFDPPVGPPGSDSNICFGDSGGPLFADVGAGATIVGIHSGATGGCTAPTDAFDTDVFAVHSWIEAEAGADLDNTQCGDGFQVGDVQVTTWSASGSVSGQAFHSFAVPPGTKLLNLGLNAEFGNPPNNFDLYLKFGAPPSVGDFDCSSTFLGSLESCEIPDPAAGSWHVLVDALAGSGDYQVNAALFPSNPDPPGLAPGEIVVTDFVGWELMQVDRSSGDRAVTSSPVRGTGPGLASPEGMSTDGTGAIAVANLSRSNVIRIDPTTGDRSLISGCVDFGCTSRLGAGPDFLGPRSVALQTDHRLIVTDRSSAPVSAVVRVDPASGDRTLLSGCADPSCSGVVGGGPLFDSVLGASVEPGGAILVADSFAVLRVDPDTGDRSVLSGCADVSCTSQVGTGPGFGDPSDVAVDYTGDILVTDSSPGSAFRAIFRVDPGTGARTVLSGCANSSCSALVGSGSNFSDGLVGIGVDPSGDIWVADREFEAVFHVDPMTGNRTIASGCIDAGCTTLAGVGTQFTQPLDVIVLPEPDQWLSLTTAVAFLAVLGLPRGVRGPPR